MSLEYAVERLYDLGWVPESGKLLQRLDDGRPYPAVADIHRAFTEAGLKLTLRSVALFDCHRAEWSATDGDKSRAGYCVGTSEAEAAVYAFAKLLATRTEVGV